MINRRDLLKHAAALLPAMIIKDSLLAATLNNNYAIKGPFQPDWKSLEQYQVPDWFRDAKFGMWAHWGPQCQPEHGDWYAREMYMEGSDKYKFHCEKYGHPSKFGFKDVINEWKAEKWDPEHIVSLYKKTGAKYFMALANHHDNFDLWNSKHQRWNAVMMGPRKDLIGGWAKAARKNDLPFGVSIHSAHAWSWYETSQRSDKAGPFTGIPYDGKLTTADGNGKWWNGYDPQELYAQNHPLSENSLDNGAIHRQWNWGNGVAVPSKQYCENFHDRVIDLIDSYEPDLLYFDDTALPLWPVSDAGLRIAAYHYNKNIKKYGKLRAVICGKILTEQQRKCMVWDIERGQSNNIEPLPWQTDTCIGAWHYDRRIYDGNGYKTAEMIVQALVDVVSKNGNYMLNVPLRGDGSIDEKEMTVIEDLGKWMHINSEAIYGTRPWKVYGEGPSVSVANPLNAQGFNEGRKNAYTAADIRFTKKNNELFAFLFAWPEGATAAIQSLGKQAGNVEKVQLLGHDGNLSFQQMDDKLLVTMPEQSPCKYVYALKINGNLKRGNV